MFTERTIASINQRPHPASAFQKPAVSINCTDCQANGHQYSAEKSIHVTGHCGDARTMGDCFGVVFYPIKNPSAQLHERMCDSVKLSQERVAA